MAAAAADDAEAAADVADAAAEIIASKKLLAEAHVKLAKISDMTRDAPADKQSPASPEPKPQTDEWW